MAVHSRVDNGRLSPQRAAYSGSTTVFMAFLAPAARLGAPVPSAPNPMIRASTRPCVGDRNDEPHRRRHHRPRGPVAAARLAASIRSARGHDGTAAMTEDVAEAQALLDDLVALLDAGLVVAVEDGGTVRYGATDTTYSENTPAEPVNDRRSP